MHEPSTRGRRRFLLGAGLAATVGLAGCAGFTGPTVVEESTETLTVNTFDALVVENRNGDVRIERDPDEADSVPIRVRKRGRSQAALDRVRVALDAEDRVLTVATVGERLAAVTVDLVVTLPEPPVELRAARTGNGDVTAEGVVGDATLTTGNGDSEAVDVDGYVTVESANGDALARGTTGVAGARTANGDVDVAVRAIRDDVSLTSANGDVTAGVAPSLDAAVELSTGTGSIETEAALADRRDTTDRVTGRLGAGGPTLSLSTGNGDVRLYELGSG